LNETNWKFKQNTQTLDGDKSFFKCGENVKCKSGYQFLYNTKDMSNAVNMVNQWSIDRTKQKIYQHSVHVKIDDWKMAYTWMKENGRILKINDKPHHFIVYKSKYDNLLYQYQHLLLNENLNFTFDEITNVVSHIFYVIINTLNWLYSSCTCCNYFKTYMCIHVMSVAVSCDLVKIPHHCKLMLPVGSKPKRGRIPNALKGLKKQ
jgi:hypothetical protein